MTSIKGKYKSSHLEERNYEDTNGPSNDSVSHIPGPGYEKLRSSSSGTRFDQYNNFKPETKKPNNDDRRHSIVNSKILDMNLDFSSKMLALRKERLDPLSWQIDCMNRFSNEMFTKLAITDHENVSISPFNIYLVLLMVRLVVNSGAFNEIENILGNKNKNEGDYKILLEESIGNGDYFKMVSGVFIDSSLKIDESFEKIAKNKLKALIEKLDFKQDSGAQLRHINNLICSKTDDNISELFTEGSIDANTNMVLATALHFQWAWKKPFKSSTSRTFWNSGTTPVEVNMMYVNGIIKHYHDEKLRYAAIMLPSQNEEYSMIIILPDDKDGLKQFDFTNIDVYELLDTPDLRTTEGDVYLPSFKIDQSMDFEKILSTKFGCLTMFKKGPQFRNIDGNAWINKFMHKTYVDVHANGIGVPSYINTGLSGKYSNDYTPRTIVFEADHPFAYYIMYMKEDTTGMILSGGVVTTIDPVEN